MTGGFGNFMNGAVMEKMNSKNWTKVLAGFEKHSESGELVNEKTVLDLDAVSEVRA